MIRNRIYLILFFLCFIGTLNGQDPHFSQSFVSPIQQNPALTGLFEGDVRAGIHYRQQWSSVLQSQAFKTYSASVEKKFFGPGNDFFNFGFQALHDAAGTSNYKRNEVHLALSYQRLLFENKQSSHYFNLGMVAGAGQFTMSNDGLWFSRQFDPNQVAINTGLGNGEPVLGGELQTDIFLDVSLGGMYYAIFNKNNNLYIGAAMYHLNAPDISLIPNTSSESLYSRLSVQIGGELAISDELSVLPAVVFWGQGPYFELIYGGTLWYKHNDWQDVALRIGPSIRVANQIERSQIDALIIETRLEVKNWSFGMSYDINVSSLKSSSRSRGALEFSLVYISGEKTRKGKVKCPKY